MTGRKFRVTNITLDEEEDVTGMTALADGDAYSLITSILGEVETTSTGRDGEATVVLPVAGAVKLLRACEKAHDNKPDKVNYAVYRSLSRIYNSIIE